MPEGASQRSTAQSSTKPFHEKCVVVVDDEKCVRDSLRVILEGAGYAVVCFADGTALLEFLRKCSPVCLFLEVYLPGKSGFEILSEIRQFSVPVFLMSGRGDIPTAVNAIKCGALDFVQKPFRRADILNAINSIRSDALHPKIKSSPFYLPGKEFLTRREREVLKQVSSGSSTRECALALGISPRTVEDHRSNIMRKLGVKNSMELMIEVLRKQY